VLSTKKIDHRQHHPNRLYFFFGFACTTTTKSFLVSLTIMVPDFSTPIIVDDDMDYKAIGQCLIAVVKAFADLLDLSPGCSTLPLPPDSIWHCSSSCSGISFFFDLLT
jgi:hypothetical protein